MSDVVLIEKPGTRSTGLTDIPPSSFFCNTFPTSCYDTFVTMREVVDDASPAC